MTGLQHLFSSGTLAIWPSCGAWHDHACDAPADLCGMSRSACPCWSSRSWLSPRQYPRLAHPVVSGRERSRHRRASTTSPTRAIGALWLPPPENLQPAALGTPLAPLDIPDRLALDWCATIGRCLRPVG